MTDLDNLLDRYHASRVRLTRVGFDPIERLASGGDLADAVERIGVAPLAGMLADQDQLILYDEGVSLTLCRDGASVTVEVCWEGGPTHCFSLPFPLGGGPISLPVEDHARFLPDPDTRVEELRSALHTPSQPLFFTASGTYTAGTHGRGEPLLGMIPSVDASDLSAHGFCEAHGVVAPYVAGAMAGGIASPALVIAMSRAGMLGFFGSGGLPLDQVEVALKEIQTALGKDARAGVNLLHNPNEPAMEEESVDLYLRYGFRLVSASAYMNLTAAIVRYRLTGIHQSSDGRIICPNKVFAKVSRPEVAGRFMRPAPEKILNELVERGVLTPAQLVLARQVPIAEDITAEADSGGHTDRRPLVALLPTLLRLREQISEEEGYDERGIQLRVGAGGGLGDPASVYAAFAMGADYVLTGSVNQATVEAGTSTLAKEMVASASFADCTTGPAPDMFELGAHVQVLGRGTLYAQRAGRLYNVYRTYPGLSSIPDAERKKLEKTIFRRPLDEVWTETHAYWTARDPREVARAESDPRHQMALTFRWYLGMTSRWARLGTEDRKRDFQIWCGPSMGLFNNWVAGSWLEPIAQRTVVGIAHALLDGAAGLRRVEIARGLLAGKALLPSALDNPRPRRRG